MRITHVEGAQVEVNALLEKSEHAHPVYRLAVEERTLRGEVVRLNYARHAAINGFVLGDGTFVHVKPAGTRKHRVRVGDDVSVLGERRVGPAAPVVDAIAVKRNHPVKRSLAKDRAEM